ncbi:MAG: hypothetical protein K5829_04660 [Treponema sp.]|nr:hypothetical protein [Treponema sp.]
MSTKNLNEIPEMIASGKISKETALQKLAIFVMKEGKVFGLQKYDEDFRSEIIVNLLEKGTSIFDSFNPNYGSFFTYFFCLIKGIAQSLLKEYSRKDIKENVFYSESVMSYHDKEEAYRNINYRDFEKPKIPYSYKKIEAKALEIACKSGTYHIKKYIDSSAATQENEILRENLKKLPSSIADKIVLVLALKAAYYITDSQINLICEMFKLDKNLLYNLIQQLKDQLLTREIRKTELENRRNAAYFHHKSYTQQINKLDASYKVNAIYNKISIKQKYTKKTNSWKHLTEQLQNGTLNLRPTNKSIAKVLGLCERQISHYLLTAQKLGLKL